MNKKHPLDPKSSIPDLLKKYNLRPKKSLGQNFLVDENALKKVIAAAEVSATETVLEVGPGLGSLTRHLAARTKNVIAVELDKKLIPPFREVMAPYDNVTIIQGDILEQDIGQLLAGLGLSDSGHSFAVIANIPYYITSALIRHLLEAEIKPDRLVLTVQKEVAMRICAEPPDMSLLALSVQVYGEPGIAAKIPAGAFYPAPQVDSAVIRIDLYPIPVIPAPHTEVFFRMAKAGFSQKRKNLRNSLSAGLRISKDQAVAILEEAEIDPKRRAQTLNLAEWHTLTRIYSQSKN